MSGALPGSVWSAILGTRVRRFRKNATRDQQIRLALALVILPGLGAFFAIAGEPLALLAVVLGFTLPWFARQWAASHLVATALTAVGAALFVLGLVYVIPAVRTAIGGTAHSDALLFFFLLVVCGYVSFTFLLLSDERVTVEHERRDQWAPGTFWGELRLGLTGLWRAADRSGAGQSARLQPGAAATAGRSTATTVQMEQAASSQEPAQRGVEPGPAPSGSDLRTRLNLSRPPIAGTAVGETRLALARLWDRLRRLGGRSASS